MGAGDARQLVTRREAEQLLGYAAGSLKQLMRQQPDRWPDPVERSTRGGQPHRYDLDELRAAAGSSGGRVGRRSSLPDSDHAVECLSCGWRGRSLGPHLARAHQMTAAEYRAEHGLPRGAALMAGATRARLHETGTARVERDPRVRESLTSHSPDEQQRRLADAHAGRDEVADHPWVQQTRRDSRDRADQHLRQQQADRRDQLARDAGWSDWTAAIAGTAERSERDAAAQLGVSRSTVQRWRRRLRAST